MNGLTKQEQNWANCYHAFNRKFVRAIFRSTKNTEIPLSIYVHVDPTKETLSICAQDDSFSIKITMMEVKQSYRSMSSMETHIDYGIDKKSYDSFVRMRNEISDLVFKMIGDKN